MLDDNIKFMQADNIVSSKKIFSGVILDLYVNNIELNGQVVERELIHHKPAVVILAVDNEDRIVLVKQYRTAIDKFIYELPAGIVDEGEDYLTAAKRELEEETTYQAATWSDLGGFYVSPGYLDEWIQLYYAKDLTVATNPLPQDDDEYVVCEAFTKGEVLNMLRAGELIDLKTLYGVSLWMNLGVDSLV